MADGSVIIDTELNNDGLNKDINNIDKSFNRLKSIAVKAISAIGFGTLVKEGITYNATVEQLQTSFEVMTGSAEKATGVIEKLKEIGARTPFEFVGLAETTQLLMNYGFTADEAIDRMQMLGDISQGSAEKMNRIAMAYGQMSSAGKVSLEDVKQMIEAGFNPLQEISQSTGESMASLYDRISEGTISVDEITAAMQRATSEGGKYFQSMDKQSQTLNGQWSTLKDNFSNILGSILKPISEMLTNNILPAVNDFMGKLQEKIDNGDLESFANTLQKILGIIIPLTAAFVAYKTAVGISEIIQGVTKALNGMTIAQYSLKIATSLTLNPIGLVVAAVTALAAGIIYLWNTNEDFRKAVTKIWNKIKDTVSDVVDGIVGFLTKTIPDAWNDFTNKLKELTNNIWNTLVNGWNSIVSFFTETIPQWIQNIISWFQQLPYNIGLLIGQIIGHIVQFGVNVWNWITVELPLIIQGIIQWFAELPGNIWTWLCNVVDEISKWGQNTWNTATTWVSNTINSIVNWFKELPGRIWTWLTNTINNVIKWGKDLVDKGKTAAKDLVNNIVDTIKELPEDMFNIGKNIVEGLWNGIKNMGDWIEGKVSDFISGITDGVKGVLGIHSPSTVFRDEVGKNMALGIGEGFDNSLSSIFRKMQSAVAFETQKLSAKLSTSTSMNKILTANITLNPADIYMDSTKVGRMVTPTVSRTIKAGGI